MQLQESELPDRITVREALDLFASFYATPADPRALIDDLGLRDKRDTAYRHLSGGQKQRLSIALALIGRPRIAILDELSTGLDPQARRETWHLIEEVRDEVGETHRRRAKTRRAIGTASHQFHVGSRSFALGALLTVVLFAGSRTVARDADALQHFMKEARTA